MLRGVYYTTDVRKAIFPDARYIRSRRFLSTEVREDDSDIARLTLLHARL